MASIKVSVTIPVYNTEKYLYKCLESLSNQSMKDIEFILVDDGSTDKSGSICDEYALKDSRFKVIHQENGGSACARQKGLNASIGEYVIICDSDDWVEPDMYEMLYEKAFSEDADIVRCDYYSEYQNGRSVLNHTSFKKNKNNIDLVDYVYNGAGASFVQLIRRSLYSKNNIYYEPGINLGEDVLITLKLLKCKPRIVKLDKGLYHYRRLFGMNTYTNRMTNEKIKQLYLKYHWIQLNYSSAEFDDMRVNYALSIVFSSMRTSDDIDIIQLKDFIKTEFKWNKIFRMRKSLKLLVVVFSKILPISVVKRIVNTFYPYFYK